MIHVETHYNQTEIIVSEEVEISVSGSDGLRKQQLGNLIQWYLNNDIETLNGVIDILSINIDHNFSKYYERGDV